MSSSGRRTPQWRSIGLGPEELEKAGKMNRSILIIMVPALLVAVGYVVVLRMMGFAPGYPRLIIAMVLFFGGIYWLSKRSGKKANSSGQ
jgi:hypothetical protein